MKSMRSERLGKVLICLAVLGLSPMACGKKGPPFIPYLVRQPVLDSMDLAPVRGGLLLAWAEVAELPPPPAKREWYGYRVSRREGTGDFAEVKTLRIAGKGGMRYEHLDLAVKAGVGYTYRVELLTDDRKATAVLREISSTAGGGPAAPRSLKAAEGDRRVSLDWEHCNEHHTAG
jgi:hypothetical protein